MVSMYCHKVRVAVVLVKDDRLLLVRQNKRDFWVFPGGTLEPGEGMFECGVREIREEINFDIAIERVLYLADFILPPAPGEERPRQTIDVFLLGRFLGGEARLQTDENLDDMGFFTWEEFNNLWVEPSVAAERVREDWPWQFPCEAGVYLGTYGPMRGAS